MPPCGFGQLAQCSMLLLTFGAVVVSDVLDGVADDLLVVDVGLGGDLAADHDHAGLGHSLAGDLKLKKKSNAMICR